MEKYLVASTGNTLDSKVSGRFGHANYFLAVDPQTMKFEAFLGIQADEPAQNINQLIYSDIKKVIVGNIGPSSFYEITYSGFKIYQYRNMRVFEAIKRVENGEIEPVNEPTLSDSIHSGSKSGESEHGQGRGMHRGKGRCIGSGERKKLLG